jgi:hypothetical protein
VISKICKILPKNNKICQTYTFSNEKKHNFLIKKTPIISMYNSLGKRGTKKIPYVEKRGNTKC